MYLSTWYTTDRVDKNKATATAQHKLHRLNVGSTPTQAPTRVNIFSNSDQTPDLNRRKNKNIQIKFSHIQP